MAIKNLGRVTGLSAYEIWLKQGNTGTEEDFLNSLKAEGNIIIYSTDTDSVIREKLMSVVKNDNLTNSIFYSSDGGNKEIVGLYSLVHTSQTDTYRVFIFSLLLFGQNYEVYFTISIDNTLSKTASVTDAYATETFVTNKIAEAQLGSGNGSGLTTEQINALDGMFKVCAYIKEDISTEYETFKIAFGIDSEGGNEEPEPDTTKTLQSISATYTGGNVRVGTSVNSLTGLTVKAHYSDGTSSNVTDYTLSGAIVEGNNTITVTYQGLTTTFTVVGVAESGGDTDGDDAEMMDIMKDVEWISGIWLNANGVETAMDNRSSSEKIPFTAGEQVICKFTKKNYQGNIYCYNENDEFLTMYQTAYGVIGEDQVLTACDGTAYIRSTLPINTINEEPKPMQMLITKREV